MCGGMMDGRTVGCPRPTPDSDRKTPEIAVAEVPTLDDRMKSLLQEVWNAECLDGLVVLYSHREGKGNQTQCSMLFEGNDLIVDGLLRWASVDVSDEILSEEGDDE